MNSPSSTHGALYLHLAWRNLWRNKRRSFLLITSVVIAVFIAVIYTALQIGQNEYLVHVTVTLSTGHLQVHERGYWNKRSLDETMVLSGQIEKDIQALPGVLHTAPRLETFSLASHGTLTKVVSVIAIDPDQEDLMTELRARLIKGRFFRADGQGILLTEGLARQLAAAPGDSVVLYGQGYHGATAAAIVPVEGILKFPTPDLNNVLVYLPLTYAQQLYAAPGRLTSLSILLDNANALPATAARVRQLVDGSKEVMTWQELMPAVVQAIDGNNGGTALMLLILYVVIGFGIFGTVMMMTIERTREFGILISIGMKRSRLIAITAIESITLSMIGSVAGVLLSFPLVAWFHLHPVQLTGDYAQAMLTYGFEPIIPVSVDPLVFAIQGMIVFGVGACSALYPFLMIRTLHPVKAVHG
jgi:ABC-type lipoprotein release transport system permease subunit